MLPHINLRSFGFVSAILFATVSLALLVQNTMQAVERALQSRALIRLPIERGEPVSIRAVRFNGTTVRSNRTFNAKDDWLGDVTVTLRNKSQKRIVFAAIQLQFLRKDNSNAPIAIARIEYGDDGLLTRPLTNDDFSQVLAPGQSVDVGLSKEISEALTNALPEIGYTHGGDRVGLRLEKVIFDDGRMWSGGTILDRDSLDPSRWVATEIARLKKSPTKTDARVETGTSKASTLSSYAEPANSIYKRFFSHVVVDGPCHDSFLGTVAVACDASGCTYSSDLMNPWTGGNYFTAGASSLCTRSGRTCNEWHTTTIENSCGSGGGGGGGGLEGGCSSDDECDFGYYCDQWGECQRYEE